MRPLVTVQKNEKLNTVFAVDEKGPGGANHEYHIRMMSDRPTSGFPVAGIEFQKGPRNEEDSQHGVIDSDLLEIVADRLRSFQKGDYSCRENAIALTHIEEALLWINKRVEDRIERNVLGRNKK